MKHMITITLFLLIAGCNTPPESSHFKDTDGNRQPPVGAKEWCLDNMELYYCEQLIKVEGRG